MCDPQAANATIRVALRPSAIRFALVWYTPHKVQHRIPRSVHALSDADVAIQAGLWLGTLAGCWGRLLGPDGQMVRPTECAA